MGKGANQVELAVDVVLVDLSLIPALSNTLESGYVARYVRRRKGDILCVRGS